MLYWLKQPWVQILIVILIALGFIVGIYFYGKSVQRGQTKAERDSVIIEQDKKIQEILVKADKERKDGLILKAKNDEQTKIIDGDIKNARESQEKLKKDIKEEQNELDEQYKKDLASIKNMSPCERCHDICRRSAEFAKTDPAFEPYKCVEGKCDSECKTN